MYPSIDIDALDVGFLPGTGSVVHSELTPRQYLDLLTVFSAAPLDPSGRSERIAARLLMAVRRERMFDRERPCPAIRRARESSAVDQGATTVEDHHDT
jgi:hypothetical protein